MTHIVITVTIPLSSHDKLGKKSHFKRNNLKMQKQSVQKQSQYCFFYKKIRTCIKEEFLNSKKTQFLLIQNIQECVGTYHHLIIFFFLKETGLQVALKCGKVLERRKRWLPYAFRGLQQRIIHLIEPSPLQPPRSHQPSLMSSFTTWKMQQRENLFNVF